MFTARAKITDLEGQVARLNRKADFKAPISNKDKDLAAKDVEIAELKRRLQEQVDKSESLEIDLEAKKSKAASAEEASRKAEEARAIRSSALNVAQNNFAEVQGIVDTLASEAEWMRGRGLVLLTRAENAYNHLALPVMDLVTKALEHDDRCHRLKAIRDPPEMVAVSDEEEPAGDDGERDGNDDDDKHDDDGDGHE
ncbi:hypothetical protein Hanom_Chr02g00144141 [Helianthus anomalus]